MHVEWFRQRRKTVYSNKQLFGVNTVYQFYLFKLMVLGKITGLDIDREMGNQCGYPKCCVDNFVALSALGFMPNAYMKGSYGESEPVGYVQCLKCRIPLK